MGISDELWERLEPMLPPSRKREENRRYLRREGGGRKPRAQREMFEAVLHVLRTRCAWQRLPARFGSVSTVHRHFNRWMKAGVFHAIWSNGLAEHPEMQGIHWTWKYDDNGRPCWRPVHGAASGRPRARRAQAGATPAETTGELPPACKLARNLQRFISR